MKQNIFSTSKFFSVMTHAILALLATTQFGCSSKPESIPPNSYGIVTIDSSTEYVFSSSPSNIGGMCKGWNTISIQKIGSASTGIINLICWQERNGNIYTASEGTVEQRAVPVNSIAWRSNDVKIDSNRNPDPPKENNYQKNTSNQSTLNEFVFNSPSKVYSALEKAVPKKSEYETKKDYSKKLDDLAKETLYDNVSINGELAFSVPQESTSINYNPETKAFIVELKVNYGSQFNVTMVRVLRQPITISPDRLFAIREWFRKNKFKDIEFEQSIYLDVTNNTGSSCIYGIVKSPAESAKDLKGNLSVVVVGKLRKPYFEESEISPFSNDSTLNEFVNAIKLSVNSIYFIDKRSRKVLTSTYIRKPLDKCETYRLY